MHLLDRSLLAAALFIGLLPAAPAQEDLSPAESSSPGTPKEQFVNAMRKAITPAGRSYLAKLQALEKKYAAAGKFEAAIATRDERNSLAEFLGTGSSEEPTTTIAAAPDESTRPLELISFRDTDADISDGAKFTDDGLVLPEIGATASWALGGSEPGGYEIIVHYTSNSDLTVQAKESFFRLTTKLPSTNGKRSSISLGTLKITSKSDTIALAKTAGDSPNLIIHSTKPFFPFGFRQFLF